MRGVHVYKLGGPALEDPRLLPPLAQALRNEDADVVIVHGGGRRVNAMLDRLGLGSHFVGGRRHTSAAAMEVVEMVLSGTVNRALAAGLSHLGLPAVGLSGRDAGLIRARLEPGLGRVGIPERIDATTLRVLLESGLLPVVSPVSDAEDEQAVNVNADEAALGVALELGARRLVYLSDVDGVRVGSQTLTDLDARAADELIANDSITGGMTLKVRVALDAARAGVPEVIIAGHARLIGEFPGTSIRVDIESMVEATA